MRIVGSRKASQRQQHAAPGQHARQHVRDAMRLGNGKRLRLRRLVETMPPGSAGQRTLNTQEGADQAQEGNSLPQHRSAVARAIREDFDHHAGTRGRSRRGRRSGDRSTGLPRSPAMPKALSRSRNLLNLAMLAVDLRTVPVIERYTTVSVWMTSRPNFTPSSSGPSVTPVAADDHVAGGQVGHVVFLASGSLMPISRRARRFSCVSRIRRPCIWPPTQRSAAAASTPSGAPPMPR